MRGGAQSRRQIECKRVPAENKSALGAGSALEKVESGMESKISTNTGAPEDKKMLRHFKMVMRDQLRR